MLDNEFNQNQPTKLEFAEEEDDNLDLKDDAKELNFATEETTVGTYIWQPKRDIFIWDANIHRLYGLEPLNMPKCFTEWLEKIYPSDREFVNQKMQLAITQKKFQPFEFRVVLPNGSVLIILNTGIVSVNFNQEIDQVSIISVNITKTRQTEVAWLHSQNKLKELNQQLEELVNTRTQALANFSNNLKQLHRIKINNYTEIEDLYRDYLETGQKIFNLSNGFISKIQSQSYQILGVESELDLVSGQIFNLQDTYCSQIIKEGKTITYSWVNEIENIESQLIYRNFPLKSYIGTPIFVQGKIYGILSFFSTQSRKQDFAQQEEEIIELMSHGIGQAIAQYQAELERKQAEQALRDSEIRFYGVFQSAAIGMAIISLKGSWLAVNPALCQMLGYSEAELKEITFQAITYADDLYQDLTYFDMLLQGDIDHYQIEKRYIHKQGRLVWVNISISLVRNELNQPSYFVKLVKNITQSKEAEKALTQSEEEFRSLVSNIPGAIYRCECDSNWTMNFISNAIEGICGYKAVEFIDNQVRSYGSIIHPKDQEYVEYVKLTKSKQTISFQHRVPSIVNQGLAAQKPFILEYRIIHKDGSIRWVYDKGKGIFDKYGNILYLNGAIFDISDRKQADQALRESEQRYRNLYHNTPVMLHSSDSTGRIISVSNYWLKYLGYERNEVIGKKYFEFFTQESRLYVQQVVLPQFYELVNYIDIPYQVICKNGKIIDVILSAIAEKDDSGKVIRSLAVMVDVTKHNQAEAAIQQAKKKLRKANIDLEKRVKERTNELLEAKEAAESANQAKDHFLAHISHELRTPLNSILGFTQILEKDLNLNENQQENIQLISQSGKHLLTLINDILDFSKIKAHKLVLDQKPFCFSVFLDDLVSLIRIKAEENNLSFNYQSFHDLPNVVHGDETRLKQVLLNLLGNAIKFTSEGGVNLRVGYVKNFVNQPTESSQTITANKIRFEVEDTGTGIPLDKLEAIFLPFEQVNNTLVGKKGTGLGLSISDSILQLMDSKIQVKSTLGKGSIFWFDVHLASVNSDIVCAPISQLSHPIGFRGEGRRILIVDDIPANIILLSRWLKSVGFEIAEAKNGKEGLALACSFKPDAILVDLVMPVMNGIEMASKIREDFQLREIIIFAISANVQFSQSIKLDKKLFATFLSKPIDLNLLLNLLGTYLKLEWIGTETNTNNIDTSTESLVIPPGEIIEELFNLSNLGDLNQVVEKTALLKQSNVKYSLFTQRIEQLAANFEQNNLLRFLQSLKVKNC